jgi:hypothetical protein
MTQKLICKYVLQIYEKISKVLKKNHGKYGKYEALVGVPRRSDLRFRLLKSVPPHKKKAQPKLDLPF